MSSFANLKRNKTFEKLTKAVEATSNPDSSNKNDDRFWTPSVDKAGNGMATIRFLPAPAVDGDDALPWVRIFSHGFQGPGGWLIDNCLTTLEQKCPVCESNSILWNSGIDANKQIARDRKRKLIYIANVYIVSDSSNPENEGKVMLFKFGKKIFDKITEAMNPEFADETPLNPFDFWEGANFKLKMRTVEGYRNYDKSEFESPSALLDGDDTKLEKLWKSQYSLKEFLDPSNFKTYDQIKNRLNVVLGASVPTTTVESVRTLAEPDNSEIPYEAPASNGDDEDLDYFKNLANMN